MENNWTKRLLACILSLALVLLALPAGIGGAFQASASAPSTTDPYASVDEATMIAGQNLGILGNENRLMEWEYDQNTKMYVNKFTGNVVMQFQIAGTPFAITHNSQDTQKRFFGTGMSSVFDHSITKINDDAYIFTESDGSRRYFLSQNNWEDSYGNKLSITQNGYTVTGEHRVLEFSNDGKLVKLDQIFQMEKPTPQSVTISAHLRYDPAGILTDISTDAKYGNIHFTPTKEGDIIDAKDIKFDNMLYGYDNTFSWYYSGIMAFGDIRNTDGTGVCVVLMHPLGELYEPNSGIRLSPRYSEDYTHCVAVEQTTATTVMNPNIWEFAYGNHQTTVTDPDGAKTTYYFDKWGNPIDAPDPEPDPDPAPAVPVSEEASGLNLGVNTPSNLLSGWDLGAVVHANVNAFTGNLVFETKLPDAFSLYYNSQTAQENEFGKYIASEANRVIEKISNTLYVLTEFDGSRHYFYERTPGSGTLTDKSGAVLNVSAADTYTITSGGSARQTFRKSDGRSTDVTVNADGNMSAYKTNTFTYFPATSSRGPRVQKILKNSTDAASFGYSTQGNIATTIRADGTTLLLTYDSAGTAVTDVKDIMSSARLHITYTTGADGVQRVASIEQYGADGAKLDEVTLSYGTDKDGNSQTTVTQSDGTEATTSYDKWGNPVEDPGPDPDPEIPVSEQARERNLGVNNAASMLEGWGLGDVIQANANAFSGNLVFEAKLPNAFSLYYNSQSEQENEFGKYFASEANRVMEKLSGKVYVLTEFDGSRHYFYERTPGSLTDENGAVLDVSGADTYVITSGGSNRQTFRKSDGRSTDVTVNADGNMTAFGGNTFLYYAATADRGPRVQKIQKNGADAASFGYSTQGNIATTIRADGTTLLLTYDSTGSVITGIQNIMDGSRLAFAYITGEDGVRRVSSIQQFDASGTKLDEVTLSYGTDSDGNSQTTVTKADGTETVTSYDVWGNPIGDPGPGPSVPASEQAMGLNLGVNNLANMLEGWNLGDIIHANANAFSGNLVLEAKLPNAFSLYYNSQSAQENEFGKYFASAANTVLEKIDDMVYLLTEFDGSRHYFYERTPGSLTDEHGALLDVSGSEMYVITAGSSTRLTYRKSDGRPTNVIVGADGTMSAYNSNTFTYYAATDTRGPRVQKIQKNGVDAASFGYNQNGNLTTTIRADGVTLLLTYDSTGSVITGVQNIMDGSRLAFAYVTGADEIRRIASMQQFDGSGAKLDEVTFAYGKDADGYSQTTVTKADGTKIITSYDEWGNPVAEPEPSVPAGQVAQGLNLGILNSANLVRSWNLTDGVTASVNAYNGNIVLQTGIPGAFPLVFNAQGEQQTEFGRDFTSAGNRKIDKVSDDVYVMTESDGSLHYFTYDKSPGKLQDERGIFLYVRETYYELQNGASYTVRFDKTTGRETTNTYNPDGTIASFGENITFTYYAATDTRGPRVQNILQNGASKITLGYRTDGNISTIILASGATLLFTYDSTGSTITGIQNIMDGSRITFSYTADANGLQRANKIEQFNGSGTKADEVALSYTQDGNGNWTTKMVKVLESVETTYHFDAYGNQI